MVYIKGVELNGKFYTSDVIERIRSNMDSIVLVDKYDVDYYLEDLVGEIIYSSDRLFSVESEGDSIKIFEIQENSSIFEGSLPQESTVKQLKKIRRKTKSVTIDDEINKNGNPIDNGVESYQDFQKKNKIKFGIKGKN